MEEKKDDDISIDLSRVKEFFRRKEESKEDISSQEISQKEKSYGDEDVSIDFSKIKENVKGIFKKDSNKPKFENTEEFSLDIKQLTGFFAKYGPLFLLLIPIF